MSKKILFEEKKKKRLEAGKDPRGPGERALAAEMQAAKTKQTVKKVEAELEKAKALAATGASGSAEEVHALEGELERLKASGVVTDKTIATIKSSLDDSLELDAAQAEALAAIQAEMLRYREMPMQLAALAQSSAETAGKLATVVYDLDLVEANVASNAEAISSTSRLLGDHIATFGAFRRHSIDQLRRRGLASHGSTADDLRNGFIVIEGKGRTYGIDLVNAIILKRFLGIDISIAPADAASSVLARAGLFSYTGNTLVTDVKVITVSEGTPLSIDPANVIATHYSASLDAGGAVLALVTSAIATVVPPNVLLTTATTGGDAGKTRPGPTDAAGAAVLPGAAFPSGVVFMVAAAPRVAVTGWGTNQPIGSATSLAMPGLLRPDGSPFPPSPADAALRIVTVPAGAAPVRLTVRSTGKIVQSQDAASALRGAIALFAGQLDPLAVVGAELFGNAAANWISGDEAQTWITMLDTVRKRMTGT